MKQKFFKRLAAAAVLLLSAATAMAHDFEVDGIFYNKGDWYDTATVTYKGNSYDAYEYEYSGAVTIPSEVTYEGTTYSVTSIDMYAFYACSGLTSVVIPNSLTSIGDDAFRACSGLTSVVIPNSVTSIGDDAFRYCSGLTSVVIPNSLTSISQFAFCGCDGLTSVEIPNSVTSIGRHAFAGCSGLTSVVIPNSVRSIGDHAFENCSGLTSVEIPNSVTSIGDEAFQYCSGLESITVESGNTVYDSRDNCNALIKTATNKLLRGCNNTIIPNSVTSIGSYAFYNCSGLTSVEIPNSVTYIGELAFKDCSNIELVFYNATNSASGGTVFDSSCTFVIGENVTNLPNKLFYFYCTVVSHATVPPVISANTFGSAIVYVSSAAYPDYFIDDVWGDMTIRRIETPVASIALNVDNTHISTNSSSQLTATITPADATMKTLYWSSDNPKVARVDQNGKVQGLGNGVATITAMAIDGSGVVATCHVTVGEIIAETLELDPAEIKIETYESAVITPIYTPTDISNTNFEWTSSNESVARCKKNDNGTITVLGITDGEVIITCHTTDGSDLTATCSVTVGTGAVDGIEADAVTVRAVNGMIRVEGAEDARVEVFNTAGVCIYSGTDTEIYVPQRGLYVVKVAGRATKLAL